jgi:PTEN induced putative kinase 1
MSVRAVGVRLFKHGRSFVQHLCKRDLNTTIGDKINAVSQATAAPPSLPSAQAIPKNFALRNVGVQLGLQARRILIDNVLNRVTNSLSAELRKKATRRILFGDSGPFFALVGVSLASGTGILTKEEELEGVCWEIREAISKIKWQYHDIDESRFESNPITLNDLSLGKPIAKGTNGVVYSAKVKDEDDGVKDFPFALKMMFNYDIQSNSMEILKAMYRETVPARLYYSNHESTDWEVELANRRRHLPPHPNIVAIFSVFTDFIQEFEDSRDLCPAALPRRIHPDGEGRNMSLFLLMKQYNCSLQSFLTTAPSTRTSLMLLAQLLEGVAHLAAHGIAHRDLKADNLLLDTTEPESPILVIGDFGCCLADKNNGLTLPYTSYEIDKGGNTALMAPEIITQKPGTFSVLNYAKADLWAAGAIAYEIFGSANPFYGQNKLRNVTYKEQDLPKLPDEVPTVIQSLIGNLLKRNPNKRLDPEVAANVCQLYLWAPSAWLKQSLKLPSSAEILQWLLSLTTKVLCEGKINNKSFGNVEGRKSVGRRTYPEYLLISSFLCRAKLSNVRSALSWIQENISEIDY